jgi:CxxC-x17-CxxC domain-containing protein
MSYQDKSIQCSDCGTTFVFSAGEQEAFAQRGYTNSPKRCPECREARKAERPGNGGGNRFNGNREMYPAVCATCGQETKVPFQPRSDRPVYCSNCYNKVRANR